ncbi:MAG: DNA polymerase I [Bacteroidetes bacterium]|nr:DNA polymerase I [Bacteroidota bacterium]
MKKLFLLDGHALMYRAYYAFIRRPMINTKGLDMSAVFGFTKMLIDLMAKEQPTHLAVGFDPGGKTFRHLNYAPYKANRPEPPEAIKTALPMIRRLLEAYRIPIYMVAGFEADDVLGTLAKEAEAKDFEVYMVTPDKDYGQLVSPHIFQYKPGRSGEEWELWGEEEVCTRYQIERPEQVIDILAIQGDVSDNVPGVPGIGEVGAKKLISTYKSVENLLAHLSELPEKQRHSIEENLEQLKLSKELVTICTAVPITWEETDFEVQTPDFEKLKGLFREYEFNSLRLGTAPPRPAAITFNIIEDELPQTADLCAVIPLFTPDSDAPESLKALAVCTKEQEVHWLNCSTERMRQKYLRGFALWSTSPNNTLIGHSLKPLLKLFLREGIVPQCLIHDIELMHYLLNPERSHQLQTLAQSYLNIDFPQEEEPKPRQASLFEPLEETWSPSQKVRHCSAASAAFLLHPLLVQQLRDQELASLYTTMEMPLTVVLAQMELEGIKLDIPRIKAYGAQCSAELTDLAHHIRTLCGEPQLNISSPKQLGIVLFEKLQLDAHAKRTAGKQYATDEETLLALSDRHPIIPLILEYRSVSKLLTTYIEPLPTLANPVDGRIHTTFTQALTATGRLSSQKPNLQNIPIREERGRELRRVFVPRSEEYLLLAADYSQIELRVMAHLSKDPSFIQDFKSGADIHLATAAKIFHCLPEEVTKEQRNRAKTANFGIIYGISAFGLSQRLRITRAEAKALIEEYFKTYPQVKTYIENQIESAKSKGYVTTLFGRRRYLPDIHSKNGVVRGLAERNAVNAPIQGSAADMIKIAMTSIAQRIANQKLRSRMILQVHDELVFDMYQPEKETLMEIVKNEMEQSARLDVPIIADCGIGAHWLAAH